MGRRPAGRKYPHATTEAREPDTRFIPVIEHVKQRIAEGLEPWGTLHVMPPVDSEEIADDAKRGLFRARGRTGVSIQAGYVPAGGEGKFTVWFKVWSRAQAKAEITRRVQSGEGLPYNILRKKAD